MRLAAALPAVVALGFAGSAWAQIAAPTLQGVFPPGGQAGETVEVQIVGGNLEEVDSLWFDHPGLRGFHVKGPTFRIAVAPGVPAGPHDLRACGDSGVSNPVAFVVGERPERVETEPNDSVATAGALAPGETINGRSDKAGDVDEFAFEGRAGRRAFLELATRQIGSRLDGLVQLLDGRGQVVAQAGEGPGGDPFLDATLPADGRYRVRVQDVTYAGSPEHVYRLTWHEGPRLDAALPTAAAPGSSAPLTLFGRNLGGARLDGVAVDGGAVETIAAALPAQGGSPGLDFLPAPRFVAPGWSVRHAGSGGVSNPVRVLEAADPVIAEAEPNGEGAQVVTPPCVISGTWGEPGDRDVFRFDAKKGQTWIIEAIAERIGSPADPSLVVQRVGADGSARDVASGDDLPDPEPGFPAGIASVDASVRLSVTEDGPHQVVATDLFGSQRGDVRYRYALVIRPERPDFQLYVAPGGPTPGPAGLTVRAGGRAEALALIRRIDGFNGAVRLEATGLPPGVAMEPATIGPGQNLAPLVFTAPPGAPHALACPTVVGRSLSPDRKEVLAYEKGRSRVEPERVREAIPITALWPPTGQPAMTLTRATNGLVLAVVEGAPFELSASPREVLVKAGEAAELTVSVERREGFAEAVQVATAIVPRNVGAANVAIAKEATSGTLKVNVPGNVAPGNYTLMLRGTAPFNPPNQPPPQGRRRRRGPTAIEPSNTVLLRVIK